MLGGALLQTARADRRGRAIRVELQLDASPILPSAWDLYLLVDSDGQATTGFLGGDALLQDVSLGGGSATGLQVPWFTVRPGIVRPGQAAEVAAVVWNASDRLMGPVNLCLVAPPGSLVHGSSAHQHAFYLNPGESADHCTWAVAPHHEGTYLLRLQATVAGRRSQHVQWLTVARRRDARHEYQMAGGAWTALPPRPTLQRGNPAPLRPIVLRTSAQLKRNLFGITAHLPRSTDDEEPFAAAHLSDDDPATCWASRWWRVAVPQTPEWLRVDLGRVRQVGGFRLVPAWRNGGFPAEFTVRISADGWLWHTVVREHDYRLPRSASAQASAPQDFHFPAEAARYVSLRATRLRQGATGFFCAPFEPFQLRLAEAVALSPADAPMGAETVRVSSTFHAWYNDPASIRRTWPLLPRSGVKVNRIGQWGDKVDWATVERTKGVYRIDPEVDRAIDASTRAGVHILLTLDYGNNLYQRVGNAPDFGPTWQRGHPFLQCAPTTPEAIEGFARYCGFMARHFRGRVKYYEIWNEENGWFFDDWAANGTAEMARAYGRALMAAARAVKEADPAAKVVFGGMAGLSLDFPRIALQQGAGPYVDVLAFHPYGHPTPEAPAADFLTLTGDRFEWRPRPADLHSYEDEVAALRQLGRAFNPRMEVWADEMNWFAPGEPPSAALGDQSELTQAKYLARFYALNAWLGCAAVWWSLYNANGVQEWAVLRSVDFSPRPAYFAAAGMATVLDDVRAAPDIRVDVQGRPPAGLTAKAYRNGRGEVLIGLWRAAPADDACVPSPTTVRVQSRAGRIVELLDPLYGVRQRAEVRIRAARTEVPDVLVGDWPVFVRLGTR